MSSFSRDVTRTSWPRRCHSVTLQPTAHLEQMLGVWVMSHGRDSKRHTREVRAPTGQRSMMLPLKIDCSGWSNRLVIYDWTPPWPTVSPPAHAISLYTRRQRSHR